MNQPHNDTTLMATYVKQLRDLHAEMAQHLLALKANMPKRHYPDQDVVDIGYLCRASKDLLEDWRKVAHLAEEVAGSVISQRVTEQSMQNPETDTTVHGTLAYAVCDVKVIPYLPDQGTEAYFQMMGDLGVPREVAKIGNIKLDYHKCQQHVRNLAEEGKPMPKWCKSTYPQFVATFTRKKITASS